MKKEKPIKDEFTKKEIPQQSNHSLLIDIFNKLDDILIALKK
jgi:hypothetical protein